MNYDTMTVAELRRLACERKIGDGIWRAGASKEKLVQALTSGKVDVCQVVRNDSAPKPAPAPANFMDIFNQSISSIVETQVLEAVSALAPQETLQAMIKEELAKHSRTITVQRIDGTRKDVGRQHKMFETVLRIAQARQNVYMVGGAGSGKTTCARMVAEALGLRYAYIPLSSQTGKHEIFGHIGVNGYVGTMFADFYENGGVMLFDEFDASNENIVVSINSAIENGHCAFPHKMVKRHPDFVCIASGNTYGTGASREYVGRRQQDAATLNRFVYVKFDYDEDLERSLVDAKYHDWVSYVQKVRRAVDTLKVRHIVSPRASIIGASLLAAGLSREQVEAGVLWQGLASDTVEKIKSNVR